MKENEILGRMYYRCTSLAQWSLLFNRTDVGGTISVI